MKNFILALLVVTLTAASATAQVTSAFNQDYGLASNVSNTWDVTTGTAQGLSASLRVELNSGSIYQNGDENPPLTTATGDERYDSYMTGGYDTDYDAIPPTDGATPFVLGNAYDIDEGTPDDAVFELNDQLIDATWVPTEGPMAGSLMLARVTLPIDASGTFKLRVGLKDNDPTFYLGGMVVNGRMLFTPPRPGDADFDGDVDDADAAILASFWQTAATGPGQGDFNDDDLANDLDATILAANWTGSLAAASAAVPEPSTLLLAAFACMTLLLRVRKSGRGRE